MPESKALPLGSLKACANSVAPGNFNQMNTQLIFQQVASQQGASLQMMPTPSASLPMHLNSPSGTGAVLASVPGSAVPNLVSSSVQITGPVVQDQFPAASGVCALNQVIGSAPGPSAPSLPILPNINLGGAMVSLSELQPDVQPPYIHTSEQAGQQFLDGLGPALQRDSEFSRAVKAGQLEAASSAAVQVAKALAAQHLRGPQHISSSLDAQHSDWLSVNQRVLIYNGSRRANSRGAAQEAVIVSLPDDEWVFVRIGDSAEAMRVARRNVIPMPTEIGAVSHDLMDVDLLDGDMDAFLGTDDGLMLDGAISGCTSQQPQVGAAAGVVLPLPAQTPAVTQPPFGHLPGKALPLAAQGAPIVSPEAKAELVRRVKQDALDLEAKVPWVLAKLSWLAARDTWRSSVQAAEETIELVRNLCQFHDALRTHVPPGPSAPEQAPLPKCGSMRSLLEALVSEISAGRCPHAMLEGRWEDARKGVESWLSAQDAPRLLAISPSIAKAIVRLEQAASEGDDALIQMPLEAMLRNDERALSLLQGMLEENCLELLNGADSSAGHGLSFAQGLRSKLARAAEETNGEDTDDGSDATDVDGIPVCAA
uniref:Uncharacterized protein n=2 Tax=Tetraselmis sp. GSL018 TaxID=582737 RepID=A0A061S5P6_9CHLO|mmetsp:Transcript_37286/g.88622  ORF Transcript_37286/g.88622 Transcript_37286/m.88622 type:complete len:595 (-) Transcript_37286:197-1981(-)|eukprot:CAMPEP_0177603218 /NCGR_PEP_ID=MMETSP0419_2-20121207/15374_1 /TAXON_ID=582737 /ORGANISM="Tetraselmis sp., Strain GSL018" /LENGTH=594 /DNA_ID=CAMNT_0019096933 /DNA_START=105 /DNA_END=1889 /DNA_ORIENTATION=-